MSNRDDINCFGKVVNVETGEVFDANDIKPIEVIRKTITNFNNDNLLSSSYFHLMANEEMSLAERLDLNFADLGKVLLLLTYTRFRNINNKMYISFDNSIIANGKNIKLFKEKLKINSEQFKRFKKRLMERNVLFEDDVGFYFKDDLLIRGKIYGNEKKNKNFYRMYDETIREIYDVLVIENKVASSKGLGLLACLIPMMQKQNNVLMSKYYNEETKDLQPLKPIHVADILDIDRHVLSREIKSMNKLAMQKMGKMLIYEVSLKAFGETDESKIQRAILIDPTFSYNSHGDNFKNVLDNLMELNATKIQ